MSIQLDWHIDDEPRPPPTPAAAGPRRSRRRLALPALLALLLAAVFLVWLAGTWRARQRELDRQAEEELRRTIALAAEAYRTRDQELFLALQDTGDRAWIARQRAWFAGRNAWPKTLPYDYTLRVLAVHFAGGGAWVELEEQRPENSAYASWYPDLAAAIPAVVYRRVAFYRHDAGRWLQVAPPPASPYWGETRVREASRFTVRYPAADEPVVQAWLATLVPLADRVCADLACPDDLRWTLVVSPTAPADVLDGWATGALTATLVSPSLAGYRADGALDGDSGFALASDVILTAIDRTGGKPAFAVVLPQPNSTYALVAWTAFVFELCDSHDARTWAIRAFCAHVDRALRGWLAKSFSPDWPEIGRDYVPLARLGDRINLINPGGGYVDVPQMGVIKFAGHVFNIARTVEAPSGAETYSLMRYLPSVYGRSALGALLRAAADAASVGAAVHTAVGVRDLSGFESNWLIYSRRAYGGE
jgi:hypothetical protein